MSRKIEGDAFPTEESTATPTISTSLAKSLDNPVDSLVSGPPPTYGQDLEVRR
ncbi:hypothetical protein [Sphingomonas sp. TZW2008]|uniref:hypothetical protein n=1 Tax=Sphingomonas sp. TZW2008 TaxID=1917973 RepID=UPI0015C503CD|nr:hypothetical protein [Sphingomonas sp. TZW2008]